MYQKIAMISNPCGLYPEKVLDACNGGKLAVPGGVKVTDVRGDLGHLTITTQVDDAAAEAALDRWCHLVEGLDRLCFGQDPVIRDLTTPTPKAPAAKTAA